MGKGIKKRERLQHVNVARIGVPLTKAASSQRSQLQASHIKDEPKAANPSIRGKKSAYQHAPTLERIDQSDLSLYHEVEHYPEQNKLNTLFSLSIHV